MRPDPSSIRKGQLSEVKRALLEKRLKGERTSPKKKQTISKRPTESTIPLSFAQERLWFFQLLEPDNPAYNASYSFRLSGKVDVRACEESLNTIIQRHEILRTIFVEQNGNQQAISAGNSFSPKPTDEREGVILKIDPRVGGQGRAGGDFHKPGGAAAQEQQKLRQIVSPNQRITVPIIDLCQHSEHEQTSAIHYWQMETSQQPFDFSQWPLFRVKFLKLTSHETLALMTMHHMITDGWSIGVFIQEFFALYQAYTRGNSLTLPELPVQYADYSVWQRHYMQGGVLDHQLKFWKEQLAGAPSLLQLPLDHPRAPVQTYPGKSYPFTLSAELTERIRQLSQSKKTTFFMTSLATFAVLLNRYSGQEDILIGSPVANRDRPETQPLIGCMVNTLVFRIRLEDAPTFSELLSQVRQTALQTYAHQEVPFEQVVEALQPERNLSYTPLFQVMIVHQNSPITTLESPELTLRPLPPEVHTTLFDLTLKIDESGSQLSGSWEYNTDLFENETIRRMDGHFQRLLTEVITNPHRPITQIPILSDVELNRTLVQWNDTDSEYPQDKCIHELFEKQSSLNPEEFAVVCSGEKLSYSQLNHRANQVAHYLQRLGVKPDIRVGLYVERSLEMVVGLLGILKAGGAYVPLDPSYPGERIAAMIEDAEIQVVLTIESLLNVLSKHSTTVVCFDKDGDAIGRESVENPVSEVTPDHSIYAIFTSGTTGRSKGVSVYHRGFVNLVDWYTTEFRLFELKRVLLVTSFNFDLTQKNIFAPLITGGTLYLSPSEIYDPQCIVDSMDRYKIAWLNCTPSMFYPLVDLLTNSADAAQAKTAAEHDRFAKLSSLRYVFLGGEPIQISLLMDWLNSISTRAHIVNTYGPTECTDVCAYYRLKQPKRFLGNSVPLGTPIHNTQLMILDRHDNLLPVGIPGELCIAGVCVGGGYINDSERTSSHFITNPFGDSPNSQTLYKTGDLARYLPDGMIEFIGRVDNQVKIRGFRIELGEIEAALNNHSQVQQSIVRVWGEQPHEKRLVAYVVTEKAAFSEIDWRAYLKQKLPEYMVPSLFMFLEKCPLTANGKVDFDALPVPNINHGRSVKFVPPQSSDEKTLATIWQEVLNCERVSVHDNFFEIGGDSILSIQVVSRAREAGIHISPKEIFQFQTLAQLAQSVDKSLPALAQQELVTGSVPLMPIQHWFLERGWSEPHHFNQYVLLRVPADVEPKLLSKSIHKLREHHDSLRLRFTETQKGWHQVNDTIDSWEPLQVLDLSSHPQGARLREVDEITARTQASLNLEKAQLMRVVLFELGEQGNRLLIVVHHLAVDAVSWRILLEDLIRIYQQLKQGKSPQLPLKTSAFRDWTNRLHDYGQSEDVQKQLQYWLGLPWAEIRPLPRDYPVDTREIHHMKPLPDIGKCNTPIDSYDIVASQLNISTRFSIEHTHVLLNKLPATYNVHVQEILLAALVHTIHQWTGSSITMLDLEGHGREDLFEDMDLSRTVGWFTSLFPALLKSDQRDRAKQALLSVRDQLRSIPQRGIGYGLLRYLTRSPEVRNQLRALPTPEICFNYLGRIDQYLSSHNQEQISENDWKFTTAGASFSPRGERAYLLEVNALVEDDQLQVVWTYSPNRHQASTIENLAHVYLNYLVSLIEDC